MKEHILETQMEIPLKLVEVFPFFCDIENLERITPPELHFEIITPRPIEITLGAVVDYRLQLYVIPFRWQSEITVWRPPHEFVDEQIHGPYKLWMHRHLFYEENGNTIIEDKVRYQLPLWPLGEVAHPLVRLQLKHIFEYRQRATRDALLGKR
ncbi:MAG: SRPBCC family protein [Chloroflexota bacterium]|nr:SRPBCC family protein [Chloroflexota bacterium]